MIASSLHVSRAAPRALVLALLAATPLAACGGRVPLRRPGSDITLPESGAGSALRELLVPCTRERADSLVRRGTRSHDCKESVADTNAVSDPQRTAPAHKTP